MLMAPFAAERIRKIPLACDCHMHVFGPPDQFPGAVLRSYSPQEAPLASWRRMADSLGLERVVVIQPSAYGTDNSCVVNAIREMGPHARGIAQIDASTSDTALQNLHAAGIRGVRLNPKSARLRDPAVVRDLLENTGRRLAPMGWHVELHAELELVRELIEAIRSVPVTVVLDHMGGSRAADSPAALRPMLDLLAGGRCWVKLSGADRVSQLESGFADSIPIARALIRANPEQVVWGSDWPHTAAHAGTLRADAPPIAFRKIDPAHLFRCLADAAGDEPTLARILAVNPARLYGF